jgi:hypothetical protein
MEERVTPGAFYGSAIAALCGLVFGLVLHGPWENHPGGPRLQFSSAAAAETHPTTDPAAYDDSQAPSADDIQAIASEQLANFDNAYNDPGFIPPDPLPVTRLAPDRFGSDDAEIKVASVEPVAFDGGGDEAADTARAPAVSDFN